MNLVRSQNLTVAGVVVHQDAEGRYSLNDLHRAAGGDKAFQPSNFMRMDFVGGLIDAISNSSHMSNINPVESRTGRYGGTYVCWELVYAYANWISPSFYLNVIRTYDALVTSSYHPFQPSDELLPQPVMQQVGGMVNAVSRKQMDEALTDALVRVLPAMLRAEMASTHMSVRRGLTAGECWKIHGLPTKGLRGYSKWFGHRLTEIGCCISNGPSKHASNVTLLFDPDRVSALMRLGFKATCERYVRKRLVRTIYFLSPNNSQSVT
ncbi:MAG: KilA-N domain-containing protein [Methylotenera sp.]|nr:KilA-N domain-containing protein [Methylotenera sp.]